MATRTFHISFPLEWAEEIEKEIKKEHYTPSEYFKMLYREMKIQGEERDFQKALKNYEKEKKAGKLKELKTISELMG